jgi:hypothetical protein
LKLLISIGLIMNNHILQIRVNKSHDQLVKEIVSKDSDNLIMLNY